MSLLPLSFKFANNSKKKEMDIEYFIAFFSYECLSINKNGLCSWQEGFLSSDTGRSLATCVLMSDTKHNVHINFGLVNVKLKSTWTEFQMIESITWTHFKIWLKTSIYDFVQMRKEFMNIVFPQSLKTILRAAITFIFLLYLHVILLN